MKPKINRFLAATAFSVTALSSSAFAARLYKDVTTTDLNTVANWAEASGGITDPASIGTTDALRFNEIFAPTSGTNYTAALSADLTVGGIELDSGSAGGSAATGNVIISAGNTLTLNGASAADINYATGGIVLNSGTGGTLTVNANILVGATQQWITSRGLTVGGNVDLGSATARTLTVNTATTTLPLITGVISGNTGNFTKSGNGTLYLNNVANSFGGIVAVAGGTLKVDKLAISGSNSSIGSGSSSIVLNGGTLNYVGTTTDTTDRAIEMRAGAAINNNGTGGSISFTAANVAQPVTTLIPASARTMTLGGSNANANTFGSILGDSGTTPNISRLQKSGTGKWIVTGTHTYTGATVINQGSLVVNGSAVLGGIAGSVTDESNIWFTSINANAALHFETVANLGAVDQIRFRNTGGTAGLGGALVYVGNTDQTLSKTIQCDTTIGIRLESNSVGGKLTFNGAFNQANRALYLGGTGSGDNTLGTAFTGSGGIIKRDAGTWILTGTNTYTGATTINGGTLALGASNVLANTAVSIGAATLATAAGVSDTVGTLDTTAAATIHVGSGATLAFAASSGIDWSDIPGTLNITGTFVSATSGNPGSLRFGTTNTGLTSIQLGKITAAGFTDFGLDADGYLTATAVAAGYSSWATANGAPGQTADLDHDNDGVSNGVEYFLGGPSGNTTGFTVLPGVVNIGGVRSVTWTMASTYDGTYGADFGVETSATLAAGSWATETLGGNVAISGDTVTYTFPAGPVKTFARLKVIDP